MPVQKNFDFNKAIINLSQYALILPKPKDNTFSVETAKTDSKKELAEYVIRLLSEGPPNLKPEEDNEKAMVNLVGNKTLKRYFRKARDCELLNGFRNEIQKALWRTALAASQTDTIPDSSDLNDTQKALEAVYPSLKIAWLLSTFAILGPRAGMVLHIPQRVAGKWYSVPCRISPHEITPAITKYGTQVRNRVYSYVMQPVDGADTSMLPREAKKLKLNSYVINKGTVPGTLMGSSTQKISNILPFREVGKTFDLSPLLDYIEQNHEEYHLVVAGLSLGGAVTTLLFDQMDSLRQSIVTGFAINPPPRLLPGTRAVTAPGHRVYAYKDDILQRMGGHYPNGMQVHILDHVQKCDQLFKALGAKSKNAVKRWISKLKASAILHNAGPMRGGTLTTYQAKDYQVADTAWGHAFMLLRTHFFRCVLFLFFPYFMRFMTFLGISLLVCTLRLDLMCHAAEWLWGVVPGSPVMLAAWAVIVALISATLLYFAVTVLINVLLGDGRYVGRLFEGGTATLKTCAFLLPSVAVTSSLAVLPLLAHFDMLVVLSLLSLPFVLYAVVYAVQYVYHVCTFDVVIRNQEYDVFLSEEHNTLDLKTLFTKTLQSQDDVVDDVVPLIKVTGV